MLRSLLSIVAGLVTWPLVAFPLNAAVRGAAPTGFDAEGFTADPNLLILVMLAATLASFAAGWVTAAVANRRRLAHAAVLGAIHLGVGVFVQVGVWDRAPVWYHLVFLALVVPAHLAGGKIPSEAAGERRPAASIAA